MPIAAESLAGQISTLAESAGIRVAIDWVRKERAWINEQHLKLCRIPAPTFFEEKRAVWMADRFRALGWDAKIDRAGNVIATLAGRRDRASIAVTAHLDTVLAPRTPEEIKISGDGKLSGPGVSDNGAGLTALLALAALWQQGSPFEDEALAPMLIANVGEEGEGNLSGMRYLCRAKGSLPRAFLVLDGPSLDHITSQALASRRFEVTFTGPGGHSWSDYGTPNPVHALSRVVTLFGDAFGDDAGTAKSSFNFGVIEGGASINSIPNEARAKLDLRSESAHRLDELAALLNTTVARAAEIENARGDRGGPRGMGRVIGRTKEIGSRPGGGLSDDAPLLAAIRAVDAHLGIRSHLDCSSTDANVPLSLGIPAVSIGVGGQGGGAHTTAEWYLPEGRELGLRRLLLTLGILLQSE
jgi:tripeptide aminopeptidase